jgi:anti-anti-sigma factor
VEPELSDAPEFSVTSARLNGCTVINVTGELDLTTAPQLEEALAACNGSRPVVDLTALTFIDSSGLHVLLQERREGRPAALVIAPGSHVAHVFDIVHASKIVLVCSDLQAAVGGSDLTRS